MGQRDHGLKGYAAWERKEGEDARHARVHLHLGLLNLRLGLAWAQNLWEPGFLTYVAAPATWFVPDALAGAALDLNAAGGTLSLAPVLLEDQARAVLPLYFPSFWATVTAARGAGAAMTTGALALLHGSPLAVSSSFTHRWASVASALRVNEPNWASYAWAVRSSASRKSVEALAITLTLVLILRAQYGSLYGHLQHLKLNSF